MKRYFFLILFSVATLLPSPVAAQNKGGNHNAQVAQNLERFAEIYRMLDLFYVDSLSADTVMQWAIEGMLARIDPFTTYFKQDNDELRQMTTGKYAGIGSIIRYSKKHDRCLIEEPYKDTPSDKVGLRAGDILISIDGTDLKGKLTPDVSNMLRGEAGTKFTLVYQRPGEANESKVEITRETISLPAVPYYGCINDKVGYILLTNFTDGCAKNVRHALLDLKNQGIKSLVLDLRNNPGGALNEAVDIVNLFVGKGIKVVYTKGKVVPANRDYMTTTDAVDEQLPVVVLVNEGTASSAEIVSGSLQDLDRAVVMGKKTYGKGLVQSVRELQTGGSVKITTSRYYIPSGRCIQAHDYKHDGTESVVPDSLTKVFYTKGGREVRDGGGIKPDITTKDPELPNMFWSAFLSEAFNDWCTEYRLTHEQIAPVRDFQLSEEDIQDFVTKVCQEDTSICADTLLKYKKELRLSIEPEIISRYYYNPGTVEFLTTCDPVVREALDLIMDEKKYKNILKK